MTLRVNIINRVRALRLELLAMWLTMKNPRTPQMAKVLFFVVLGFALSPIDLIPDIIPVIGLLDDIILLPIGIAIVRRLIPPDVMQEGRDILMETGETKLPKRLSGLLIVIVLWLCFVAVGAYAVLQFFPG